MKKLSLLILLLGHLLGTSRRAAAAGYVFSTFKGDDAAGMKLSIYRSSDSINFTLVSDTGFGGNTSYLRDPTIMRHTDGKYYIAYTDPNTASCCNPEDHFGVAVSSDLIRWTDVTTVKAGVANVLHVWAPEWFIEDGVVRVIANIDTGNADFRQYVFTAQNSALTSWSGPTALNIGTNYIDTFVAKLGSTYHAFIKSEATRFLEHATATSLNGPWTFVGRGDWAGWGNGLEGASIVRLDDGRYRMYVDPQQAGAYQYMTSSDLNSWSAKTSLPGPAGTVVRHGTIIRDEPALGSDAGAYAGPDGSSDAGDAMAVVNEGGEDTASSSVVLDSGRSVERMDAFVTESGAATRADGAADSAAVDSAGVTGPTPPPSPAGADSARTPGNDGAGCSCRTVGYAPHRREGLPLAGLVLSGVAWLAAAARRPAKKSNAGKR